MNHDQKETAIEELKIAGTMKAAAGAAGVSVRTLNEEMRRSAIFKRRILEAREEGKQNVADGAIDRIKEYAFNPPDKTDRNVLTAAIALANAFEPGFRGTIQGRIEYDVRVLTAVPRPKYLPSPKITIDKPKKLMVKSRKVIQDEKGYIGTIEGEVIKESE